MPSQPVTAAITALDPDGRGITQVDGKTVYVQGALPGEQVSFVYSRKRRDYDEGRVERVLEASADRAEPGCPQFGICGGCALQHLQPAVQIRFKQDALIRVLDQVGGVTPHEILQPLTDGESWGYRQKARLGVKYVAKKNKVLVGFRERGSSFLTDTERCPILDPRVGELITPLSALIGGLSVRDRIPQIEVAMGDDACVLIFRLLAPASGEDRQRLLRFGETQRVAVYIQDGGPETVKPLNGAGVELNYQLPADQLQLRFLPGDFTQINAGLNRLMVAQALRLLNPLAGDRVLDLFCGLGNFTLPLARRCLTATGVEGDTGLVARAEDNARRNGIDNARFYATDLYQTPSDAPWLGQGYDKALLDPPRSGASEVIEQLPALGIERIVYVSCYPETLARDAGALVNKHGYRMLSAGMMDMFPHTAHMESIALFQR